MISVLLALLCVLPLAACGNGGDNGETKTAAQTTLEHNTEIPTKPEGNDSMSKKNEVKDSKLNFTRWDAYYANCMSTLLKTYGTVKITGINEGGSYTESYFQHYGEPAFVCTWDYDDGESSYNGWYDGIEFTNYESGKVCANIDVDDLAKRDEAGFEYRISDIFEDVNIKLVSESADSYTLSAESVYEDYDFDCTIVVDKGTLAVRKTVYNYGEFDYVTEYEYGAQLKDDEMLACWNENNLKTVTVISEDINFSSESKVTSKVEIPCEWELKVFSDKEINIWLDKDYTKEYVYPGDYKDYTIYITTTMG